MKPTRITSGSRSVEVETLYQVFHQYNTGPAPEGCPCCVDSTDQRLLITQPLETLTWDHLSHFARKAMTTWGDTRSFRRFLPRILEILEQNCPVDVEIVLGKLRLAEWRQWPVDQQESVTAFLRTLWKRQLALPLDATNSLDLEELICGLVCAGCTMQPFLEDWIDCRTSAGYEQLASFASCPFSNAFWNQGYVEQEQLNIWLSSSSTLKHLERIFEENVNAIFTQSLATVIDAVERFQVRPS